MSNSTRAYYVLLLGGSGTGAGFEIARLHHRMGRPFPLKLHAIDSDKTLRTRSHPFHAFTFIGLKPAEVDTLRANVELHGSAAEIINEDFDEFLHREDVEAGSRARRALTQLFAAYHAETLAEDVRQQVQDLMSEAQAESIQPVLVGSVGGGFGSAGMILAPFILSQSESRNQILAGFDDSVLRRPIVFAAEAYAMADQNNEIQQHLIYGNAFAFRQEAGYLQDKNLLAEVNLTGLSNSKGVVLKTISQLHRQLGSAAFWHMQHVDLIESVKANFGFTHYAGKDAPELYGNGHVAGGNGRRDNS